MKSPEDLHAVALAVPSAGSSMGLHSQPSGQLENVNCLTTDVHWKRQEREGTISGSPLGKALWIHHLGTEVFPTAHHLPFSFKLLTSVPSGGRNLGGTAWHHCFHLPVCMNHQSGSVNHQSPPRVVLYSKYILCCSKVPRQPGPAGAWSAWI